MKLTVVGCSGSGPGPDSPASCYLIEQDGFRLVLDLGNGSLGQLARYTDIRTIDAVVLSHLHADHCLDACALMVVHRFHPAGRPAPISMLGPRGTTERLLAADAGSPSLHDVFTVADLSPGARELGPFRLEAARVNHPVETYALRVTTEGRSLTYSADTGECPALIELARDTDLLLCEASFVEPAAHERSNPPNVHLSGRQAGEHAAAAGVGRLLLTHIPMWIDPARVLTEASGTFPAAELVHSGSTYDL
ncbi:MAG: MBL fold metallo-hydrolase [Geodermatophilaceae bacterium]|nr:MBL fold metallo-hydrolase [Geodermatophilaceae bacterium]